MSEYKQLAKIVLPLVIIVIYGTCGYMIIEGWSLSDALYMTVITLSTVGYMEEILIHDTSLFLGLTMAEAREKCIRGANILAVKKKADLLMVLGTKMQFTEMEGVG